MLYPKALLLAALLAGCATTPAPVEPPPPPPPAPPRPAGPPLLTIVLPVVSPEMLADAVHRVQTSMELANGVIRTRDSFKMTGSAENVGQVGWTSQHAVFALNDEIVGTVPRDQPCGSDWLQLAWRQVPVGQARVNTTLATEPSWWRVGDAHVRVGATDLIGVANDTRNHKDCALWGVIVEGPARVDAEVNSPGSSGPTDGSKAVVFAEETNLVVATTGVTLGGDPDNDIAPTVQLTPSFEATCAHARWAGDLLGTRTLRVRFTDGPQVDGCPTGNLIEEFAHALGPDGELARTERQRQEPTRTERDDRVVRNIGVGRLIWEAKTTQTRSDDECGTTVEEVVATWTLKYPQQADKTATARRVRTTSCSLEAEHRDG